MLFELVGVPFLSAFLSCVVLTLIVRRYSRQTGVVDVPGAHKQHAAPTATLGGLAVYGAFLIGVVARGVPTPKLSTILVAGTFLVLVGSLDDLRGVSAKVKLACLALAALVLEHGGIHLWFEAWSPISWIGTFLWVGLIASSFNGVDNADGAAPGLAAVAAGSTFVIAWCTWQRDLALVSLTLCAACLGFLCFNYPMPRASIFLGDSGSLFLGFVLSAMLLLGRWGSTPLHSAMVACLVIAVPLFDFALILLVRGFQGQYRRWSDPITMCARDHTYHRLRSCGLRPRQALALMHGTGILLGLVAYFLMQLPPSWASVVFLLVLLGLMKCGLVLARVNLPGVYERASSSG